MPGSSISKVFTKMRAPATAWAFASCIAWPSKSAAAVARSADLRSFPLDLEELISIPVLQPVMVAACRRIAAGDARNASGHTTFPYRKV
jgi:hypothetical protein